MDVTGGIRFRWQSAGMTHRGTVRTRNEDAILDLGDDGLWIVADGMGGHRRGDVASRMIVDGGSAMAGKADADLLKAAIDDGLTRVNADLVHLSRTSEGGAVIGSTVAVLGLAGETAVLGWAGDSRIYRMRGGALTQLTRDHSRVEVLVQQGVIGRDEAERHPEANVVTRAVGATDTLDVEFLTQPLADNDTYLLCSDGLPKVVSEAVMTESLKLRTCDDCARALIDTALTQGARDNVSVIVVRIEEITADP